MAVKKRKKSLLETTLITIVKLGLNVKATISTTVNSIRTRRKNSVKKAEKKAVDLKPENSLDKYKLKFEETGDGVLKLRKKKGKK